MTSEREHDRHAGLLGVLRALALAAVLPVATCAPPAPRVPPNIVIVLIDTLRADHTSVYGYERETTPNLSRIAREGMLARHHFSNAPWTKPSVASILTGLHATAHGSRLGQFETLKVFERLVAAGLPPTIEVLAEEHVTMPELLRDAGYRTAAFLSNYHLTERFGYSQGYDEYSLFRQRKIDTAVMQRTMQTLATAGGPVFLWCHLMDVHGYRAGKQYRRFKSETTTPVDGKSVGGGKTRRFSTLEEIVDSYDNAILSTDAKVGQLFDFIQEYAPNTVLVVTSDHGEELNDHGGFSHAHTLYNELIRVPLILHGPGVPVGEVEGLSDTLDLLPTVLALAGVDPPEHLAGSSLIDGARIRAGKAEVFAEQHHHGPERRFALVRQGEKVIVSESKSDGTTSVEAFADGLSIERSSLADDAVTAELVDRLRRYRERNEAMFRRLVPAPNREPLTAEDIREFDALGYVGD